LSRNARATALSSAFSRDVSAGLVVVVIRWIPSPTIMEMVVGGVNWHYRGSFSAEYVLRQIGTAGNKTRGEHRPAGDARPWRSWEYGRSGLADDPAGNFGIGI